MSVLDSYRQTLELDRVESHLHPVGSFDVDDHPVPSGREEIWRFTPLKRLRGLHQDAPLDGGGFEVKVDLADGAVRCVVEHDCAWLLANKRLDRRHDRLGRVILALLTAACIFIIAKRVSVF